MKLMFFLLLHFIISSFCLPILPSPSPHIYIYIYKEKKKKRKKESKKMNDSVANALGHNLWRLRNQLNNLTVITLDIMEVTDPQVQLSSSCVTYLSQPLFYLCSEIAWLKNWKSCWIIPFRVIFQIFGAYVFRPTANFP